MCLPIVPSSYVRHFDWDTSFAWCKLIIHSGAHRHSSCMRSSLFQSLVKLTQTGQNSGMGLRTLHFIFEAAHYRCSACRQYSGAFGKVDCLRKALAVSSFSRKIPSHIRDDTGRVTRVPGSTDGNRRIQMRYGTSAKTPYRRKSYVFH